LTRFRFRADTRSGGYDKRVRENVEHKIELEKLCETHDLIYGDADASSPERLDVIFIPSFDQTQRQYLLTHALTLLYTPSMEHFGIVPLEAMWSGTPVVAVSSGGPLETIKNGVTGYLVDSDPIEFAAAALKCMNQREQFVKNGREWVEKQFSSRTFETRLERILNEL